MTASQTSVAVEVGFASPTHAGPAGTVTSPAQLSSGSVVSMTVTVLSHVVVLPETSLLVQVMPVSPSGYGPWSSGLTPRLAPSQVSVEPTKKSACVSAPAHSTSASRQNMFGAMVSVTSTTQVAVSAALPLLSEPSQSTPVWPSAYPAVVEVSTRVPSQPSVTEQVVVASVSSPAHSTAAPVQAALGRVVSWIVTAQLATLLPLPVLSAPLQLTLCAPNAKSAVVSASTSVPSQASVTVQCVVADVAAAVAHSSVAPVQVAAGAAVSSMVMAHSASLLALPAASEPRHGMLCAWPNAYSAVVSASRITP